MFLANSLNFYKNITASLVLPHWCSKDAKSFIDDSIFYPS